jgi:membrane protein YdbS with pleckstrin-like domain
VIGAIGTARDRSTAAGPLPDATVQRSAASGLAIAGAIPARGTNAAANGAETVLLSLKPSLWFIPLHRGGYALGVLAGAVVLDQLAARGVLPMDRGSVALGAVLILLLMLAWNILDWLGRAYVLTTGRIWRRSGVIQRVHREMPLRNVQSVVLHKSARERVWRLGTVGVTSAAGGVEVSWYMIPHPERALATVREAAAAASGPTGPAALGGSGGGGGGGGGAGGGVAGGGPDAANTGGDPA